MTSSLFSQTRYGLLDLEFVQRGKKTILLRDTQKAPLMVVRPFELPCGTLMVYIINPTGGVLGGDHSQIRVQAGAGTRVLLLTQSATRVQPSQGGLAATQDIHFAVAEGARLEYYPERTIPFADSHFAQHIRADLAAGAELGLTESLSSGRVQMNERLAFGSYRSRVEVYRAGQRIYLDAQQIEGQQFARAAGIWGQADYLASGVWAGEGELAALPATQQGAHLACGYSHGGALWLRAASLRGPALDSTMNTAREQIRAELFGAQPLQIRR